jgi:hypothetical protein
MMKIRLTTANEGIETFNPMNETLLQKKIERPIDRHRLRGLIDTLERLQKVVSLHGFVIRPNQLENLFSNRGKPNAALLAKAIRLRHC